MEEAKWYTLAVSNLGTHKMLFKERLEKDEAKRQGKEYCRLHRLVYAGTFNEREVEEKETKLREIIYED